MEYYIHNVMTNKHYNALWTIVDYTLNNVYFIYLYITICEYDARRHYTYILDMFIKLY